MATVVAVVGILQSEGRHLLHAVATVVMVMTVVATIETEPAMLGTIVVATAAAAAVAGTEGLLRHRNEMHATTTGTGVARLPQRLAVTETGEAAAAAAGRMTVVVLQSVAATDDLLHRETIEAAAVAAVTMQHHRKAMVAEAAAVAAAPMLVAALLLKAEVVAAAAAAAAGTVVDTMRSRHQLSMRTIGVVAQEVVQAAAATVVAAQGMTEVAAAAAAGTEAMIEVAAAAAVAATEEGAEAEVEAAGGRINQLTQKERNIKETLKATGKNFKRSKLNTNFKSY